MTVERKISSVVDHIVQDGMHRWAMYAMQNGVRGLPSHKDAWRERRQNAGRRGIVKMHLRAIGRIEVT
jgi:hypothetical protein